VVSNDGVVPKSLLEGEILTDIAENRWKLGRSIGFRSLGEVYLAYDETDENVGSDAQYVVIVEPHENGRLFVEINRYLRMAKSGMIDQWKKSRRMKHVGLSPYIGSGSHICRGKKYRFLVQDRYGQDLGKLFLQSGRILPVKTVLYIAMQILDTLEYIHSRGYIHADIKGSSLLLGYRKDTENYVYLLDFGRSCRYLDENDVHKDYGYDEIKAHSGTLEYCSRDAHIGAFSRRGDLEGLGYNMLQWLSGRLPWEGEDDPEYVYFQKKGLMSCIPLLMLRCFPNSEPSAVLKQYLEHVATLGFKTTPNYAYCRKILRQGIEECGSVDDGKLVFGVSPFAGCFQTTHGGNKRKATQHLENIAELNAQKKMISTSWWHTRENNTTNENSTSSSGALSHRECRVEKNARANREKRAKRVAAAARKLRREPETASSSVSEPTERWHQTAHKSSLNNPTPAMLEIMSKAREKTSSATVGHRGGTSGLSRCPKRPITAGEGRRLRGSVSRDEQP
jgi:vaccinia related kinase